MNNLLSKKLGPEYLSSRTGPGGSKLTYIEGWRVMGLANEVFGYNGWSTQVRDISIDFVSTHRGRLISPTPHAVASALAFADILYDFPLISSITTKNHNAGTVMLQHSFVLPYQTDAITKMSVLERWKMLNLKQIVSKKYVSMNTTRLSCLPN
jgi:hypothetical protein